MKCVNCNAENPDGKTFCGDCGAPLDPLQANIKQYVDAAIIHQLDRRMTDQRVVEAEITEKIAGKLMSWARMLGFFIGIPATIALALLGFFGIQTYSDISSRINLFSARITDLTARAQEDARNLEIQIVTTGTLAQELQDEAKKLETQLAETKALADEVRTLNTRVGTIEKNLKFESSPALTSELQEELESYIYSYHAHLQELGFKLDGDWVKVYIDPNMLNEDHAYYDLEGNRIVFGSSVAKDKDVVLREYTHHVLTSLTANRPYSSNPQFRAIESGLADYFPCASKMTRCLEKL
jgi:hypothetical protein